MAPEKLDETRQSKELRQNMKRFALSFLFFVLSGVLSAQDILEVMIEGNRNLSDTAIKKILLIKPEPRWKFWAKRPLFDPVTFDWDKKRIERLYESEGFYRVQVKKRKQETKRGIRLRFLIDEGEPAFVESIRITSEKGELWSEVTAELPLNEGSRFREEDYRESATLISRRLQQAGYARAKVLRSAELSRNRKKVEVIYQVSRGELCRFGKISIEGLEKVRPELVRREIQLLPYQRWSLSEMALARSRIVGLELFRSVEFHPMLEEKENRLIPLQIRLREGPPRRLRLGMGYGSEEGPRAMVSWRHANFKDLGYRLEFRARVSRISRSLNAGLRMPHTPGTHYESAFNFSLGQDMEDAYDLLFTRGHAEIAYRLNREWTMRFPLNVEVLEFDEVNEKLSLATGRPPQSGLVLGPGLGLEYREASFGSTERKGWLGSVWAETSLDEVGADYTYSITRMKIAYSLPLPRRFLFSSHFRLAFLDEYDKKAPLSKRLYAGGTSTIRGYRRHRMGEQTEDGDPVGGASLALAGFELRRPISGSLLLSLFLDTARLDSREWNLRFDSVKHTPGFGLLFDLPGTPIRLDFAFPVNPGPAHSPFRLHLGLGHEF